jgi:hypothetical protein
LPPPGVVHSVDVCVLLSVAAFRVLYPSAVRDLHAVAAHILHAAAAFCVLHAVAARVLHAAVTSDANRVLREGSCTTVAAAPL